MYGHWDIFYVCLDFFDSWCEVTRVVSPLTANRPHPSMSSSTYFEAGDPRSNFCLPELDPRIHFALVCGAKVQ